MSETSTTQRAAALVEQGARALRTGDTAQAYTLLREAIKLDPNNEHAWLWLAGAVSAPEQRRECLQRVLAINPANASAQRGLAALAAADTSQFAVQPVQSAPQAAPVRPAPEAPVTQAPTIFDPLAAPKPAPVPPSAQATVFDPLSVASAPDYQSTKIVAEAEAASRPQEPMTELKSASVQESPAAAPVRRLSGTLAPEASPAEAIPASLRAVPQKRGSSRLALIGLIIALLVLAVLAILYLLSQQNSQQAAAPLATPAPLESPQPEPSPRPTQLPTPTISAAEHLSGAERLAKAQDYQGAIEQYTAALTITESAEAFFGRAQAYYALNDFANATKDYSNVIRLDSKNATAYHERARARFRTGDNEGAIADFSEALKLKPDDEPSFLRRGIVYRSMRKYAEAEADFTESIRLAPKKLDAYYHRGMVRLAQKQYATALADFNQALSIDPEHILSYAGRGAVQIGLKQYGEALKDCNTAIERDDTLIEPLLCRGQAYAGLKNYQQALNDFDAILKLYPDEAAAYRERVRVKLATNDKAGARADFEEAAKIYQNQKQSAEYEAVQKELAAIK